jgi:hypothetical protein
LLAYEGYIKHWLPSHKGDPLAGVEEFKFLHDKKISFYNKNAVDEYKTGVTPMPTKDSYQASF